jgi:hypothetical protein
MTNIYITYIEQKALDLAATVGKLAGVVAWCIAHDGECLADNPEQLEMARRTLEEARAHMGKAQ